MKKLLKRWVPLFMALALVVGAVNNNYLTAQATGSDTQIGGGTAESSEADPVLPEGEETAAQSEDASVEADTDVTGNNAGASETDTDVSGNDAGSSLLAGMGEVALMALNAANVPVVQAAATTKYYAFKDLVKKGGYGVTPTTSAEGLVSLAFEGQYQEIQYSLPAGVDGKTITNITFHVVEATGGEVSECFTGKLYYDTSNKAYYQTNVIDASAVDLSGASDVYFAIMCNKDMTPTFTLDYISITTTGAQTGGSDTPPTFTSTATTKYYAFKDLVKKGGYGVTPTTSAEGLVSLAFEGQYQEIQYSLPAGVDGKTITNITFHVVEATGGEVSECFTGKLYYDTSNKAYYQTNVIDASAVDLSGASDVYFAIMCNKDMTPTFTLDYISITTTGAQTGGSDTPPTFTSTATTKYYAFKDLVKKGGYGVTPTTSAEGLVSLAFEGQYQEIQYSLPAGVDGKTITNITFHVVEATGGEVSECFTGKLYYDTSNKAYYQTNVIDASAVDLSGASDVYFAIMCNKDMTPTFTLDYISITAVQTGGLENPPSFGDTPAPTENVTPAAKGTEDYSWKAGDMVKSSDTTSGPVEDTEQKRWKLTFAGAWQQADFDLPVSVDLSLCNSITFAVSEQTAALSFKVFAGDKELDFTKYHQNGKTLYTYETKGMTDVITKVAVMLHSEDKINATETCTFDGVMFDMKAPEEIVETYEVTYQASQLTLAEVSGEGATSEFREDRHCITFPALNNGARYTLPESISLADCESITIKVGSQTGPVNFYTCVDGTELEAFYYNIGKDSYTIVPSKGSAMNSLKVLCGGEEYTSGSCIEIISVTFLMKGVRLESPVVNGNTTTCSAGCFDFAGAAKGIDGVTVNTEMTADGKVAAEIVTFEQANLDLTIEIPATVDVKYLKSIALDFQTEQYVSGQARGLFGGRFATAASGILSVAAAGGTTGVTVSLLNADKNVIASADSSNIISLSKYFTGAKYIRFTSTGPTKMRLTGIAFNVEPPIVLNGNFEDDDVSMWTGGWSTIEAVSGDSAIVGGVSTYGKITDRTSPYQGFIQDVTARVTNGKIYKFSFWAKLSDAYKDADASLREVTFSPYYKDENGKEQYGLVPGGTYKQSLTAGEWTYFEGTVTVPANATSFVIRIIEQGTNYGQGDCLKGEYYVTGVKMWETDKADPGAGNGGGGGGGGWYDPNFRVPTKESNYQIAYEAGNLEVSWASATTATVGSSTQINFKNNYDEARFKLPRPLDMSLCAFLQVKTSNQNVPIAIKLYKNGVEVQADYYNRIDSTYVFVPKFEGNIDAVGIMSLATPNPEGAAVTVDVLTFGFTEELPPYVPPSGIVWNGDFADEDLSDWYAAYWDNVTIKQETSKTPIYDDVRTYGTYSRRTSPYQCFAQDITDRVEQGETYTFSFWAKLSNDYKDAPPEQRVVQFSPYTEDKSGKADYNPRLEGTYSQTLEPGVWTYFEGTYKVTNENPISRVVIRILEQGTQYGQGDCVKGSYSVTGVKMAVYVPEPPSIDEDVPNLRDVTAEDFGSDFLMGTAMAIDEVDDIGVEMLVKKHFSAVTLGNELKPDALFGYSNGEHTPLQTITFNGQNMEVPTLNYTRAEELLDKILEWNEAQPDKPIKVRGHVLVWHAQTPEWFFREGYTVKQNADGTENYVTPEVMNQRLEWYIKTVLEHFTGEDSPYKDLFYGWDVVNEAVADSGVYRSDKINTKEQPGDSTHSSNSSWWAVYHNNEFIINAFKYANKYAPADLELYYNDYNDSEPNKVKGIALLLSDVLAEEGTRIDAMGMQCHYTLGHPTLANMEKAIRTYAEIVGEVQLTEFDLKAAGNIGTDEGLEKEYQDQAVRYHEIYELLKKLDAEDGIEIGGFTVWGTIDSHSWLQTSSSVGGGADGTMSQCPLLFDANYKVKPAFWAFADYSQVDPEWKEAEAEEVPEEKEPVEEPETPEEPSTEEELKTASVAAASPKKGNPIPIIIAVCVAVAAVGGGSAYAFLRKKKDGAGTGSKK